MAASDPQCARWIDWSSASDSHRQPQLRGVRAVADLIGTIIVALRPNLVRGREGGRLQPDLAPMLWPVAMGGIFLVVVYGGYFGAGIGILMIGALTFISPGEIRHVVALKNFLNGWMRGVAVVVLVLEGNVNWKYGADGHWRFGWRLHRRNSVASRKPDRCSLDRNRNRSCCVRALLLEVIRADYIARRWRVGRNSEVRGDF